MTLLTDDGQSPRLDGGGSQTILGRRIDLDVKFACKLPDCSKRMDSTDGSDDFLCQCSSSGYVFKGCGNTLRHQGVHGAASDEDDWQDTRHGQGESPRTSIGEDETGEKGRDVLDDDGNLFTHGNLDQMAVGLNTSRDFTGAEVVKVGDLLSARVEPRPTS
jgi:hypothetical protein